MNRSMPISWWWPFSAADTFSRLISAYCRLICPIAVLVISAFGPATISDTFPTAAVVTVPDAEPIRVELPGITDLNTQPTFAPELVSSTDTMTVLPSTDHDWEPESNCCTELPLKP